MMTLCVTETHRRERQHRWPKSPHLSAGGSDFSKARTVSLERRGKNAVPVRVWTMHENAEPEVRLGNGLNRSGRSSGTRG